MTTEPSDTTDNGPTPTVRRARSADAKLLATLGARTFEDAFAADNTPDDMAAYVSTNFTPAKLSHELAEDSIHFLIAEVDGVPAGYAKLQWGRMESGLKAKRPVELSRVYVGREWLGRGIGAVLMERCIEEARSSGADVLWLGVWERNDRAKSFYLKWGFRKVGEHDFMLGSDRQTDWLMARNL